MDTRQASPSRSGWWRTWTQVPVLPTTLIAVSLLFVGGCSPDALEVEPAYFIIPDCDPDLPPEECDDGSGGGPGGDPDPSGLTFSSVFPSDPDLHEAEGDPLGSGPHAGVWLGDGVTPSSCFSTIGFSKSGDDDGDGLSDACEEALARSFAPWVRLSDADSCWEAEPYWGAKRFPNGWVNLAYLPAYWRDCGYGGHAGDSELIVVSVNFDTSTQHWVTQHVFTSAHFKDLVDLSNWWRYPILTFTKAAQTYPTVWVADGKHANYPSLLGCTWPDDCSNTLLGGRMPVSPDRNIGSPAYPGVLCLESIHRPRAGYEECVYSLEKKFGGWNCPAGDADCGARAYLVQLTDDPCTFEILCSDDGWRWDDDGKVGLSGSWGSDESVYPIEGPSSISYTGTSKTWEFRMTHYSLYGDAYQMFADWEYSADSVTWGSIPFSHTISTTHEHRTVGTDVRNTSRSRLSTTASDIDVPRFWLRARSNLTSSLDARHVGAPYRVDVSFPTQPLTIGGPAFIEPPETVTWTVGPFGESISSYQWHLRWQSTSTWHLVGSASTLTMSFEPGDSSFTLRLRATTLSGSVHEATQVVDVIDACLLDPELCVG